MSLSEVYVNYVCLGNVNIHTKIEDMIGICYKLDALMDHGLNVFTIPQQGSAYAAWRNQLHWYLPSL